MHFNEDKLFLHKLQEALSPLFTRKGVPQYFGSIISCGTLANLGKRNSPTL